SGRCCRSAPAATRGAGDLAWDAACRMLDQRLRQIKLPVICAPARLVAMYRQWAQTAPTATMSRRAGICGFEEVDMPAERFDFPNAQGQNLAALLDAPAGTPRAYALFAHCFTCGKDAHAARRVAEDLTALGIAVLRFDFTGLGSSEGEFANTTFSSNVADLVAAANELRRTRRAPAILIGHSLGGAAVLAAAAEVPEVRAVVTIAAPSDPTHVTGLFKDRLDEIGARGEVAVELAGRPFRISRGFVDDLAEHRLAERIADLHKALLIFHSPTDDIVGIDNATRIFIAAKHPKSFVSLAGADHLLSRRSDAAYVAGVIRAWAERYLDMLQDAPGLSDEGKLVVVRETHVGRL